VIITCNNCYKKFEISSNLISDNGRLLQCSSCNHKWFFKKETVNKSVEALKIDREQPKSSESDTLNKTTLLDSQIKQDFTNNNIITDSNISENNEEKEINKASANKSHNVKKNYNILGIIIVFIISFIALIIVLDSFQVPISKIVPNIEFILYQLYETVSDIGLFLKDLI
tara:strand:+ start:88 stop:597 length:510 start_codon:yes stop_codon:yes gene_type:complete